MSEPTLSAAPAGLPAATRGEMKQRILFVDDEPNVRDGLRRMLWPMRHEWDVSFAGGAQEALERLAQNECDVLITDMRMPGLSGAALLQEVMKRYPKVVRIILSGQSDEAAGLSAVGAAHQYLTKPCGADVLINTIKRTAGLRDVLNSDALKELVAQIENLPSLPTAYVELLEELKSDEPSIPRAAQIISRDVAMTAKILQLANSAFFAFRTRVTSPVRAVTLLGLRTTKDLVLSAQVFSEFDTSKVPGFSIEALIAHCVAVAAYAKAIAGAEAHDRRLVDDAFLAGMLHDLGKLALADRLAERYCSVMELVHQQGITAEQAERDVLGASHAEVGAYLLGFWGLPDPVVEALAFHHDPLRSANPRFAPLTAVHSANAIHHLLSAEQGHRKAWAAPPVSNPYLEEIGLARRCNAWIELCRAVPLEVPAA